MSVGIVTDSTADLPQALIDRYAPALVPLIVNWDGQTYRDKIDLTTAERDQVGIGHGPEVVPLEAEVFQAEAAFAGVGDEIRRPVLEVLHASQAHARLVDVDPVIGERLGPIDDQDDGEEIAIFQRLGGLDDGAGGRGLKARIKSRIGNVERKCFPS